MSLREPREVTQLSIIQCVKAIIIRDRQTSALRRYSFAATKPLATQDEYHYFQTADCLLLLVVRSDPTYKNRHCVVVSSANNCLLTGPEPLNDSGCCSDPPPATRANLCSRAGRQLPMSSPPFALSTSIQAGERDLRAHSLTWLLRTGYTTIITRSRRVIPGLECVD